MKAEKRKIVLAKINTKPQAKSLSDKVKSFGDEINIRWHQKMPKFFYWIVVIASGIGGMALTINTSIIAAGGVTHTWWNDIYPYIIGTCAGTIFACKFTVNGGFKTVDPDKLTGKTILDVDENKLDAQLDQKSA